MPPKKGTKRKSAKEKEEEEEAKAKEEEEKGKEIAPDGGGDDNENADGDETNKTDVGNEEEEDKDKDDERDPTVKRQKKNKDAPKEDKAVEANFDDKDNNVADEGTPTLEGEKEEDNKVHTPLSLEYPTLERVREFVPLVTCNQFEAKYRDEDPQYEQNQLELFNILIKFPVKSQLQFIEDSDSLASLRKRLASHNAKVWLTTKNMVAAEKELEKLPEKVSQALKALYDSNHMKEDALDHRVLSFLAQMKEENALLAIEDLSNQNLDVIKNVSAYFKGVCRRRNDENRDGAMFGSISTAGVGVGQEQGHAYNPALQDVQNALMRGVITPMVGTAMERLFMSNPNVQFDAAAWEEFTQLNEMMAMSCIDETFMELQNARGGVRNPNGLFVSKIRKFLGQMRNNFGGGHGNYGGVGGNFGGQGGQGNNFNNYNNNFGGRGGGGGYGGQGMDDQTIRNSLPEMYANRIVACIEQGRFQRNAVDERMLSALSQVKDPSALDKIVSEMETTNVDNVRNVAGYFMGIIRKNKNYNSGGFGGQF